MPWPPRLLVSPPLLPLLTFVLISSTSPLSSASALSFPDGQPEYPSQPELTSDRDALARIFLQGLFEKEGKSPLPHSYAKGDESDAWMINGLSPKRSDGVNSNGHHYFSLQDIYPRDLHERTYGDIAGIEEALSGQDDELSALEPHTERDRIISELLARGHPYTGHRAHGFADPSQLSDDPDEQTARLKELLRIVMGNDDSPNEYHSGYDDRHRTRSAFKDGDGAWSANKRTGSADNGLWGRSAFTKRDPFGINARGFHDDVFNRDFGSFNPMKRVARSTNEHREEGGDSRRKGKDKTESERDNKTRINGPGFGGMDKDEVPRRVKRSTKVDIKNSKPLKQDLTLSQKTKEGPATQVSLNRGERAVDDGRTNNGESIQESKRRPEMDSSGFHGDTFNSGFGDFWTMKRNSHHQNPLGILAKRRPEMDSSGFHGDTFNSGFGDFWTMKRMVDGVYPPGYDHDRVSSPGKRRPEMDSSGFHGDTFSSGFGDFYTMKRNPSGQYQEKRRPEMDSSGFHGDTFSRGFGDFYTMKRNQGLPSLHRDMKRRPEMDSSGFHGDTFDSGFGDFWTMKRNALAHHLGHPLKRRPEMDSSGFHGDTFNSGFGDFWTMKRDGTPGAVNILRGSSLQGDAPLTLKGRTGEEWHADGEDDDDGNYKLGESSLVLGKRRPEMDSSGFHGDTFNGGFGDFWTMKRNQPSQVPRMKRDVGREEKRRPEMDASGFHGDTFSNGFGDFWTLKRAGDSSQPRWMLGKLESKRRPEMDSSGFHGDTFNGGFGDFWTMKRNHPIPYPAQFSKSSKRRPEMDSSGFHGDTFDGGFGDFWTMKRGEGLDSALSGRGSFLHPSKRKPEMDSSGFHGDTFNGGFGDFWTMKRGSGNEEEIKAKQDAEEEDETKVHHVFRGEESTGGYGALAHNAKEAGGDDVEEAASKETGTRGEIEKGRGKSEGMSDNIKN